MFALILADNDVVFIPSLRNETRKNEAQKERCCIDVSARNKPMRKLKICPD